MLKGLPKTFKDFDVIFVLLMTLFLVFQGCLTRVSEERQITFTLPAL
jgi:hypothetical protein